MAGAVTNPITISNVDNASVNDIYGKQGDKLISEIHGKYYTAGYRGAVFSYSVNAVTLPVNAATLASKFAVVNPTGSGKVMELISLDWAYALATTVVNGVAVYTITATGATLTTPATSQAMRTDAPVGSVVTPYAAITIVGTPVQVALCGYTGATSSTTAAPNKYPFDGTIVITPGYSVHVAMTVAASTASGFSGTLTWAEHLV